MATKAQERKALEQIKQIVDGLGTDSYLAMAFDGCFEIAEDNIDNDFANNLKTANKNLMKKIEKTESERNDIRRSLELAKEEKESVQRDCNYWKDASRQMESKYYEEYNKRQNAEAEIENQKAEVIKLKAMLFDYMIKEKN